MRQRLYRSTYDRRIAGVCGGLAETWDLDPSLVRIAWVILTFLTGGILLVVYVVMAIIVPEGPPGWAAPWPSDRYASPASWADWNASPPNTGQPASSAGSDWQASAPESAGLGSPAAGFAPGSTVSGSAPGSMESGSAPGAMDVGAGTGPIESGTAPGGLPGAAADGTPSGAPPVPPVPPAPSSYEPWRARWDAERPARRGIGGIVFGLILVLLGGAFLLRQAVPSIDLDVLWPVVVILLGVVLIVAAFVPRGGRQS